MSARLLILSDKLNIFDHKNVCENLKCQIFLNKKAKNRVVIKNLYLNFNASFLLGNVYHAYHICLNS